MYDTDSQNSSTESDCVFVEPVIPLSFQVNVARHVRGGNAKACIHFTKHGKGWKAVGNNPEISSDTNFIYMTPPRRHRKSETLMPEDIVSHWVANEWQSFRLTTVTSGYRDNTVTDVQHFD